MGAHHIHTHSVIDNTDLTNPDTHGTAESALISNVQVICTQTRCLGQ